MKISYNWLKQYLSCNVSPEDVSKILTSTGLEVEAMETVESIKGGLKGLVVGLVEECEPHPDSDHMHVTKVNIGQPELLNVVCGAPNVAKGQKVIVATIGTVLYDGDKSFTIKKSKLRGVPSEGMICAEDEIGVGTSHDGIIVLPNDTVIGTPAAKVFNLESDIVYEVSITPNRIDGASHIGCARDIFAYMRANGKDAQLLMPKVDNFKIDDNSNKISVEIANPEACTRYSGITISGITIKESPKWLQDYLSAVGIRSINNVVDITNYILFELGQPLHAFDADKIAGKKVVVKTYPKDTLFTTLDEVERKLDENDLTISDQEKPMCLAGVFGGKDSGISQTTTNVFLESACFNPVYIRKTAKRHNLHTDAAFHYERGCDPSNTVYVLKRAAMLIKELAGGKISSDIVDIYPKEVEKVAIELEYNYLDNLTGKVLDRQLIENILLSLDFEITAKDENKLNLLAPHYRVDVTRPCDVVEEILRIYGLDNIEIPNKVQSVLSYAKKPDTQVLTIKTCDYLSAMGFCQAMSNSLSQSAYYETLESYKKENLAMVLNPLSAVMNCMRQTLLFGGLESVAFNLNHKNSDIKLYEFGNTWTYGLKKSDNKANLANYAFENHLMLIISGNKDKENWNLKPSKADFYYLKSMIVNVLQKLGYNADSLQYLDVEKSDIYAYGLKIMIGREQIAEFGCITKKLLSKFDINQEVFYGDINFDNALRYMPKELKFKQVSKYPEVKRDFALLIDENVKFEDIKKIALKTEKQYLKEVGIFDVYKDKKLGEGKKSYAVSFTFMNEEGTFKDNQIDAMMEKLRQNFEKQLGAQIR